MAFSPVHSVLCVPVFSALITAVADCLKDGHPHDQGVTVIRDSCSWALRRTGWLTLLICTGLKGWDHS